MYILSYSYGGDYVGTCMKYERTVPQKNHLKQNIFLESTVKILHENLENTKCWVNSKQEAACSLAKMKVRYPNDMHGNQYCPLLKWTWYSINRIHSKPIKLLLNQKINLEYMATGHVRYTYIATGNYCSKSLSDDVQSTISNTIKFYHWNIVLSHSDSIRYQPN